MEKLQEDPRSKLNELLMEKEDLEALSDEMGSEMHGLLGQEDDSVSEVES